MITVNDVLNQLWQLAPVYMKEDWDNVGFMMGHKSQEVKKIFIALDPFYSVCQQAADWGADLLVTHHPLFFGKVTSVTDETEVGKSALFLMEHGIAAIGMHTNLDAAPGGVNDCLAKQLGLQDAQILVPSGTTPTGMPYGIGRYGVVKPCLLSDFLTHVKQALGCHGVRYADGGKPVGRVAVGGGACASFLPQVAALGCDTFVTADVKYNQFEDAHMLGVNLIDAGHFWTENGICSYLYQELQAAFPTISLTISSKHTDITNFA